MRRALLLGLFLLPFHVSYAQVYNCNGVIGNLPCADRNKDESDNRRSDSNKQSAKAELSAAKARSKKKSLLHELSMKVIRANREYKLDYDEDIVRSFCLKEETSLIECAKKIDELSERIDNRILNLEKIKAQKKANELAEEKFKAESKDTNVTIIRQPLYVVLPTPTPVWRPGVPGNQPPRRPNWRNPNRHAPRSADSITIPAPRRN